MVVIDRDKKEKGRRCGNMVGVYTKMITMAIIEKSDWIV